LVPKTKRLNWDFIEKYKAALHPDKGKKREISEVQIQSLKSKEQQKRIDDPLSNVSYPFLIYQKFLIFPKVIKIYLF